MPKTGTEVFSLSNFVPVDMTTWNRAYLFESYRGSDFPYINLGARVDVTNVVERAKAAGLSTYFALIHTATATANDLEPFHLRIQDGGVVRYDCSTPVLTHMRKGDELFFMMRGLTGVGVREFSDDLCRKAENPPVGEERLDVKLGGIVSFSCIPWVDYTHFVRTIKKLGVDSNPKISWGKYVHENGRINVNFSVQVHHGLMDGYHVGQYFLRLQERIDAFRVD